MGHSLEVAKGSTPLLEYTLPLSNIPNFKPFHPLILDHLHHLINDQYLGLSSNNYGSALIISVLTPAIYYPVIPIKTNMSQSQNTSNQVSQQITLPENTEELIRMLGLDNNEKLVDNHMVDNFDIDSFTLTSSGIPVEIMEFQNMQDYQLVGNTMGAYQQEIISYVDMGAPF